MLKEDAPTEIIAKTKQKPNQIMKYWLGSIKASTSRKCYAGFISFRPSVKKHVVQKLKYYFYEYMCHFY